MEVRKQFAKSLRAWIRKRGHRTIELFAHENGLDKGWVYRYARGEREPRLSALVKLARALEVTLDDLFPVKADRRR